MVYGYNWAKEIRPMKQLIKLLCVFVLLLGSACAQNPAGQESAKPERTDDIYIFYTSDVHCGINENLGFAKLKALINDTKTEHENVALVDLGDYLQGGTYGTVSQGEIVIELMNTMDYDAVIFGNHELDYGMERLGELMKKANFDFTVCNIQYTGTEGNIFADVPPYIIKEYDGAKVAFIGVSTPETLTSSTPKYFKEGDEFVYDFCYSADGKKLAEQVQKTVDEARKEGADYVIALTHLGSVLENSPNDSISLIHNTRGIDAVLDGHSHSVIIGDRYPNADGEDVILSSVGTKMANAGELIIGKDGTIETLLVSEYDHEDETVKAAIEQADKELEEILSYKIGTIDFDLTIADENGIRIVRTRETNAGDFAADAIRHLMETDVAFANGGGVRHAVSAGDVTYGNLLDVFPFSNSLGSCKATGQQIMDALEFCSKDTQAITALDEKAVGEFGGFLQVSGLKYTIDTSVDTSVTVDENGMFTGISGDRRVSDVMVLENGEYVPIDPQKEYTVAGSSYFLFESGDGNTVFKDCERVVEYGPVDVEALIKYFNDLDTIPESYRTPEGRITVK